MASVSLYTTGQYPLFNKYWNQQSTFENRAAAKVGTAAYRVFALIAGAYEATKNGVAHVANAFISAYNSTRNYFCNRTVSEIKTNPEPSKQLPEIEEKEEKSDVETLSQASESFQEEKVVIHPLKGARDFIIDDVEEEKVITEPLDQVNVLFKEVEQEEAEAEALSQVSELFKETESELVENQPSLSEHISHDSITRTVLWLVPMTVKINQFGQTGIDYASAFANKSWNLGKRLATAVHEYNG